MARERIVMKTQRINVQVPIDFLKEIDEKAARAFMSRSAYILNCVRQRHEAEKALTELPKLAKALQDAEKLISQAEQKQLEN
jgi:metal-responsive CopG/Arc/MetJ family transcriptional regulator